VKRSGEEEGAGMRWKVESERRYEEG
jgi:hypothetical protein